MNLLKPHHFSTRELPEEDQFEAWRSFMSSSVDFDRPDTLQQFPADLIAWDLSGLLFARMVLPELAGPRVWRHLDKPVIDHWCLELAILGPRPEDGRAPSVDARAREITFRCLGRPCHGTAMGTYVLSLYIPRDQFAGVAPALDAVPQHIPDRGLGAVLAEYLISLDRNLPGTQEEDLPKLVEATRAVVAACLVANRGVPALERAPATGTLLERARKIIRHNLRSSELGPDELCRLMGVSRSRLYRLFEPLGGVSNYIRRQRLLQAHAALSDYRNTKHIRLIAESCGFEDASSFSRAYFAEFGYSPSDTRRAALGSYSLPPARCARDGAACDANFNDLIQSLHS